MKKLLTSLLIILLFIGLGVSIAINVLFYLDNKDLKSEKSNLSSEVNELADNLEELENEISTPQSELNCYNTSEDNRIIVNLPCSNEAISTSFELSGIAIGLFENTLNYSIETEDGEVLKEGFTTVDSPDLGLPGEYKIQIEWIPEEEIENYELHVFEISAMDGSRIHEVEIPVMIE